MNYWLIKSEPDVYPWSKFVEEGQTYWNGVRNYAARLHLIAMEVGDLAFFYHSNEGKDIVGIAEVVRKAYPDPTTDDPRWVVVDVKPVRALKRAVTLEEIKQHPKLKNMALVRISRLSVSPVTAEEFETICELAEN